MKKASLFICLLWLVSGNVATAQPERYLLPLAVLKSVCAEDSAAAIAGKMDMSLEAATDVVRQGQTMGWRATLSSVQGSFRIQRLAPGNHFRGARLEWWQNEKAELVLATGSDCQVQIARRRHYDEQGRSSEVVHLDHQLNDTSLREALNPPVPQAEAVDGIRVAIVDSGVNYTLPKINKRLARDSEGSILGYDFWDLDRRPFDANPYRSPFFPQRHGTRTASLIVREAPEATLVPYRYPRPDMSRMRALIEELTKKGIKIVAMPLGSKRISEWEVFGETAQRLNDTLFIASAGNDGLSIDTAQMYPADLGLENMIVVTSADDSGRPADGSNWGRQSVDLLVPAENRMVLDFGGREVSASGSSYAVSRIAALAARLLEEQPDWGARELKQSIYTRAVRKGFNEYVRVGLLPDPLARAGEVSIRDRQRIELKPAVRGYSLKLSIVRLENSGWDETDVSKLINEVNKIYKQCQIKLVDVRLYAVEVPPRLLDFDALSAHTLVTQVGAPRPTVYMVRDTLRQPAYDGEAFGRKNVHYRTWLRDTVWLTAGIAELGVGLAHELFHVLVNSGTHVSENENLMQARTRPGGIHLNAAQCKLARETGFANGLLFQLGE